ncbi:nuclear transport factor 2 family protein [Streptomyces bikiniensis]|uniref:Nuclear transport factor 2 family protein n=1 Tax=Streptomyces bikiniensis TaxID=1896 RepID=A0ABW8CZV0_STRBI
MSTAHHTLAAEDFTGYLRTYHADAFDGSEPVEQVWDRYHLPEGTHVVNGKVWDRKKLLRDIESRRALGAPYELHVHEVNVEGRLAAARYTVSTPMLWKVQSATETAVFAEIADDGRVARTTTFATTGAGWSGAGGETTYDSAARPAPGTVPAPRPDAGVEPTPAQDPAHFLHAYYADGYDSALPVAEVYDRLFTPDAVHEIGGKTMQRSGVLKALEEGRTRKHTYPVEVHEALRDGNRFAARYTTSRGGKPSKTQEVFVFGEFAEDGRVRFARFLLEPDHGAL